MDARPHLHPFTSRAGSPDCPQTTEHTSSEPETVCSESRPDGGSHQASTTVRNPEHSGDRNSPRHSRVTLAVVTELGYQFEPDGCRLSDPSKARKSQVPCRSPPLSRVLHWLRRRCNHVGACPYSFQRRQRPDAASARAEAHTLRVSQARRSPSRSDMATQVVTVSTLLAC